MEANARYGRDYQYYKEYEKLYGSLDIFRFLTAKKLNELGEYEEWKDYKEFKEWLSSKEKFDWKDSKDYLDWEIRKLNS
jgi:hypothetical protein